MRCNSLKIVVLTAKIYGSLPVTGLATNAFDDIARFHRAAFDQTEGFAAPPAEAAEIRRQGFVVYFDGVL